MRINEKCWKVRQFNVKPKVCLVCTIIRIWIKCLKSEVMFINHNFDVALNKDPFVLNASQNSLLKKEEKNSIWRKRCVHDIFPESYAICMNTMLHMAYNAIKINWIDRHTTTKEKIVHFWQLSHSTFVNKSIMQIDWNSNEMFDCLISKNCVISEYYHILFVWTMIIIIIWYKLFGFEFYL